MSDNDSICSLNKYMFLNLKNLTMSNVILYREYIEKGFTTSKFNRLPVNTWNMNISIENCVMSNYIISKTFQYHYIHNSG